MSWLGVNLNDGLNSLKGQLSTITRSVLTEDLEDIDGDESQVMVPRNRIKELEALCQLQKHEVEEGRRTREEMEERLQAAHLTTAHQTTALRSQLQITQTELQQLRERTSEWVWEAGDGSGEGPAITKPYKQHHQVQQQELLNQQLSRRVEELEEELSTIRYKNQQPAGGAEEKEAQPTPTPAAHFTKVEDGEAARDATSRGALEVVERERAELQCTVSSLQTELHQAKQEAVVETEKAEELRKRCDVLESENQRHLTSLEELDTQHEAAVEQILKKKREALDEAQLLRESHGEITQLLLQAQADIHLQEEKVQHLQANKQQMEQELHQLSANLANVNGKAALVEKFEDTVCELEKEREELHYGMTKLEDELRIVREREQLQCSLLGERNKNEEELLELQRKYKEEHGCNTELRLTLEKLKTELEEARLSKTEISHSYELLEEKRESALREVASLKQQLLSLTEKICVLSATTKESKSYQDEEEDKKKMLEEKLSVREIENKNPEKEVQNSIRLLEDTKASNEILESRLQANAQELTMAKTSLINLEVKLRQAEGELTVLRKARLEESEEVKKILTSHKQHGEGANSGGVDSVGGMGSVAGVGALGRVLGEAVWQRDTLEHHVAALTHQLREKTDLLGEAELARSELERECEDLRDQLEEVQKGVRPPPEGSCRGLPTIEEEEAEGGSLVEEEEKGGITKEAQDLREEEQRGEEQERFGEIQALQAQVEALSEARGNLETEVASLRRERDGLLGQLRQVEGRTGNLANLETEAAVLRGQKQSLEIQLETMTQDMDLATVTLQDERDTLKDQLASMVLRLEDMHSEMNLFQHERNSIGQQLLTQYAAVEKKDATIRVLEGELEGLRSTLREKFAIAPRIESEIARLQEELDCVKSQLIYKDDKIDALSQIIEHFGEIFDIKNCTGTDNMFREIKGKYLALKKCLGEKEEKIKELTKLIDNLQEEFESYKKQEIETEARMSKSAENEKDLSRTKEKLEKSEIEVFQLREKVEEMAGDVNRTDKNETLRELSQVNDDLINLREEVSSLQSSLDTERDLVARLQREKEELASQGDKRVQELSQAFCEKDCLLGKRQARLSLLEGQIVELEREKTEANSERESIMAECEKLMQEKYVLLENMEEADIKTKQVEAGQEASEIGRKEAEAEQDAAQQQIAALQAERDELIAAITQKHQESLSYHAEIQRLTQVLTQTQQVSSEDKVKLIAEVHQGERALGEARSQLATLTEQLHELSTTNLDLQRNVADGIVHKTEVLGLQREVESVKGKLNGVEQERDQLRVANARFNTQYQDQAKELTSVREREGRLSAESERLRQHLVAVEETYTAEALKAEEREITLRSTLAKMEEKLANHSTFFTSANQRANVQVETLQEEVREMTAQRDDAVLCLQAAEETAHTSNQSLATLQQVLQDFQKNQSREIKEAIERTQRQLGEEQARASTITTQLNTLKGQLGEAQGGLAAAGRLGEQLARKEQMIAALKAQVVSQEEVAKRARDEVACLRTSSEGKVEKPLLRNLLVGYFATPADKRSEVLRVIAEVLDFSGEERARTGLDTQGSSWLSSIANFLAPPASNIQVTNKVDVLDHTSLSQAFIRFLEDETSPQPPARLPAVQMAQQTTEKAEKKAQAKANAATKINPLVSTGVAATTTSDPVSRTSSPLLAAASSTLTPTILTITPTPLPDSSPTLTNNPPSVSTTKYLSNLLTPAKTDENTNKQVE